jgi:hypothetical protein
MRRPTLELPARLRMKRKVSRRGFKEKEEERFLTAQADHFAGAKWKEKASACSARNDGWLR